MSSRTPPLVITNARKALPYRSTIFAAIITVLKLTCIQARSQDFVKGGGLFWKVETTVSDLDPNFHCSRIRLRRFFRPKTGDLQKKRSSPKLRRILKFERFFRPKIGDLQRKTKTKKVFTEIETDFSAEIGNSNGFSAQNQVISKNEKIKKKVFTEIEIDFPPEITNSKGSSGRITATPSQLRLPNPFGETVFIF